ncbi:MAG: hypothetical protein GY765_30040, partial [bacterium]|nr:hypothetical protein [bacterium]
EADKKVSAIFKAMPAESFEKLSVRDAWKRKLIRWHKLAGRSEEGIKIYKRFLEGKTITETLPAAARLHSHAMGAYLELGKLDEAAHVLQAVRDYCRAGKEVTDDVVSTYTRMIRDIIPVFVESKAYAGKAAEMADTFYAIVGKLKKEGNINSNTAMYFDYSVMALGRQHGLLADQVLPMLDKKIAAAKRGFEAGFHVTTKATVLHKAGKSKEAIAVIFNALEDEAFMKRVKEEEKSPLFNHIAWSLYEMKLVDKKVLAIAEKSVAHKKQGANLDTLAHVHSALGDYKKAVLCEEEAVSLAKDEDSKAEYQKNVDKWKKHLK